MEDDLLIAIHNEALVEDCGCTVVGPVGSLSAALEVARKAQLDGAILDINLDGDRVWPVAEMLEDRGVPFVFASSYSVREVPDRFRNRRLLSKPIALDTLCKALKSIGTNCA